MHNCDLSGYITLAQRLRLPILLTRNYAGQQGYSELMERVMERENEYSWRRKTNWMRHVAGALVLVWAGFWLFFGLASGIAEGLSRGGVLVHTTFPGLIFLASAVVAWRTQVIGAALLLMEGLAVLIAYPIMTYHQFRFSTIVFVILTMSLPPLVAGLLFIASWRLRTVKAEIGL